MATLHQLRQTHTHTHLYENMETELAEKSLYQNDYQLAAF